MYIYFFFGCPLSIGQPHQHYLFLLSGLQYSIATSLHRPLLPKNRGINETILKSSFTIEVQEQHTPNSLSFPFGEGLGWG